MGRLLSFFVDPLYRINGGRAPVFCGTAICHISERMNAFPTALYRAVFEIFQRFLHIDPVDRHAGYVAIFYFAICKSTVLECTSGKRNISEIAVIHTGFRKFAISQPSIVNECVAEIAVGHTPVCHFAVIEIQTIQPEETE
jgi:hypothetical protein